MAAAVKVRTAGPVIGWLTLLAVLAAQVACVTGPRTVRATVRGDNFRTRRARVRLSVACATRPPVFTG